MTPPVVANARARRRMVAALLALSLTAAACGTTESSSTPTLATQAPSTEPATETPEETAAPADAEPAEEEPAAVEEPAVVDESAEEAPAVVEEEAAPAVNLFPDIDVLNIADGATLNLAAELGGADKATLLWFFAPH